MSLHTDRAYVRACRKGAWAARRLADWDALMSIPKRELAEIAVHLAARAVGDYDQALRDGSAVAEVIEERRTLRDNGLL